MYGYKTGIDIATNSRNKEILYLRNFYLLLKKILRLITMKNRKIAGWLFER